ncbi:HEAT repeat domain-containing protein, partial [Acidobacteriia bacterium AH_259_A11_L15]|nr:HEAT repeat domain-containing protein [Acidobacteriia bacterium AH_259_A11_L15]
VEVRRAAVSSLEQYWWTGDHIVLPELEEALKDPDAKVRGTAALAIGEYIPKIHETPSFAAVPFVQQRCAQAVDAVMEVLSKDLDPQVRDTAALALGSIRYERVIEPLRRALNDRHEGVRTTAKFALDNIRKKGTRA